jgi:hypothetical protein
MDILLDDSVAPPVGHAGAKASIFQRIAAKVPELAFETVCIVISILLALWVGQKVDQAKEHRLAIKALRNFREEIQGNREFMKQALPLHRTYIQRLESIQPPIQSWNDIDKQIHFSGLGPSSAYNTAWETAVATNALVQIDYDTVKKLSSVYLRQKYVELVRQKFLDIFYNPATFHPDNAAGLVQSMYFMFQDLARVEENIIKDYDDTLRKIDERYPELGPEPAASGAPADAPTLAPEVPR